MDSRQPPVRPFTGDFIGLLRSDIQRREQRMREDNACKHIEDLNGKSCRRVLSELLEQFDELDFRERAGLTRTQKLTRKIFVVIAVEEIISKATANNWGLCIKNDFIYLYNGRYWQPLNAEEFKPFLAEAALKMGVAPLEAKYHQFKEEMYKQFVSEANMPTPERMAGITLINLQNGTFEISENGQILREQRREDFLKYQLPFEYDPSTRHPLFDKYLQRVLPDADCRKVLAEYMGYIFTTGLKLEKAAILYGSGANGKSVFFEVVNALIGSDNICSYSLQNLTKYDSYQRAELSNKLLNYASEINGKLEASIFKQLVSGEPVEARQIYGRPFVMREYGKLMFNCNELPKEVENTNAFFRRFLIIPFDSVIPENEQDPELAAKIIRDELSGVFNWMLEGLGRLLQQRTFTRSTMIREQVEDFRRESDSVAMFLDEGGYKPDPQSSILLKDLFYDYRSFCYENGYTPCSLKTVSKRLKNAGYKTERRAPGYTVYVAKKCRKHVDKCRPSARPATINGYLPGISIPGQAGIYPLTWDGANREDNCGYHYTPKEYFHDHPEKRVRG